MPDKKDNSDKKDKKDSSLKPDPKTLNTTDPQEEMEGPISSIVQGAKEEIEENEEKDKEDEEKGKWITHSYPSHHEMRISQRDVRISWCNEWLTIDYKSCITQFSSLKYTL